MSDQILLCIQCDRPFFFSSSESERYERLGFDPPRRCQECRQHKTRVQGGDGKRRDRKDARRSREADE